MPSAAVVLIGIRYTGCLGGRVVIVMRKTKDGPHQKRPENHMSYSEPTLVLSYQALKHGMTLKYSERARVRAESVP